nr:reverse transcriptase domain-containing protein [Tanacetum cinerariifolium]
MVVDFEVDPRVPLILGRSFLRTGRALIDVYGEEITLRYNPKSSNPTLVSDALIHENDVSKEPIVKSYSPTLTPFGESDFFLEEIEDSLHDDSIPTGIKNSVYDPEGDILFLEKAYWDLKHVNFDLKTAGDHRKLQLNELNKLRDQAYENFVIYKERIKKLHDSKIKNHIFNVGDQVLLFNSRLKIFSGKLKT